MNLLVNCASNLPKVLPRVLPIFQVHITGLACSNPTRPKVANGELVFFVMQTYIMLGRPKRVDELRIFARGKNAKTSQVICSKDNDNDNICKSQSMNYKREEIQYCFGAKNTAIRGVGTTFLTPT